MWRQVRKEGERRGGREGAGDPEPCREAAGKKALEPEKLEYESWLQPFRAGNLGQVSCPL